ncbi:hypothetical protein ACIPW9_20205 [Streptomyces sp. NPDC090052]|uniref:hypothetical protein n=1 Tax=Streptomyces sp. NPDC090052 TaxID=3365931 RepID=UPI00382C9E9D
MAGSAPVIQRSAAPGMPVPHAVPEASSAPAPGPNRASAPGSSAAVRPVVRPAGSGEPVVQRRAVSLPGPGGAALPASGAGTAGSADVPATTPVARPVQRSADLSGPVPSAALPGGPAAQQAAAPPVPLHIQRASVPGSVAPVPQGPAAVTGTPASFRQDGASVRGDGLPSSGLPSSGVAQAFSALPVQLSAAPQGAPSAPTAPVTPAPPAPLTARTTLPVPGAAPAPDTAGRPTAPVVALGRAASGPASAALPVVQRANPPGSKPPLLVKPPTPAAPQLSTVNVTSHSTPGGGGNGGGGAPPPPYTEHADSPPPYSAVAPNLNNGPRCDGSTEATGNRFDARELSDGQVDELTHRLMGPLTRLLRTELRMDRERIGRLRDPRR